MAKTAKLKKKQAAPHSRAARRAASPSLPVPSLPRTSSPKPTEPAHHVLKPVSSGISKRKTTKTTRAQRVRAEKAMDRAADDLDKWALKRERSIVKAGRIKKRAGGWEDVNAESMEVLGRGFEGEGEEEGGRKKKKKEKGKVKGGESAGDVEGDAHGEGAGIGADDAGEEEML